MLKSYELEYKSLEKIPKRDFKLVENTIKKDLTNIYFLHLLDIQAINITLIDEIGVNGHPFYRLDIIGDKKGIVELFQLIGYPKTDSLDDIKELEVEFMVLNFSK